MPLFRRNRSNEPVDPDARSAKSGLKYKDLSLVGELIKAGADLAEPRHVTYNLYFSSRELAEQASDEANVRLFETAVREPLPDSPDQWSLVCERTATVLGIEAIRENTDFFEALALRHNGEYGGWEASVR